MWTTVLKIRPFESSHEETLVRTEWLLNKVNILLVLPIPSFVSLYFDFRTNKTKIYRAMIFDPVEVITFITQRCNLNIYNIYKTSCQYQSSTNANNQVISTKSVDTEIHAAKISDLAGILSAGRQEIDFPSERRIFLLNMSFQLSTALTSSLRR